MSTIHILKLVKHKPMGHGVIHHNGVCQSCLEMMLEMVLETMETTVLEGRKKLLVSHSHTMYVMSNVWKELERRQGSRLVPLHREQEEEEEEEEALIWRRRGRWCR